MTVGMIFDMMIISTHALRVEGDSPNSGSFLIIW